MCQPDEKIDKLAFVQKTRPPEAEIIKTFLNTFNDKLRDISRDLDHASSGGVAETMEELGIRGLTNLLVTMFIRRDYDDYDPGQCPTAVLLVQLYQVFTAAETRAERGLRDIGDLHAPGNWWNFPMLLDRIGLLSPPSGNGDPVGIDHALQEKDLARDPDQFQRASDHPI